MTFPCLCCGVEVKRVDDDEPPTIAPNRDMWNDAMVDTVGAGFGSRHDMSRFHLALCDDCIDSAVAGGRLVKIEPSLPGAFGEAAA